MSNTNRFLELFRSTSPKRIFLTMSTLVILLFVYFSHRGLQNQFEDLSGKMLDPLDSAFVLNVQLLEISSSIFLTKEEREILKKKIGIIEQNKIHHLRMVINHYKNNYSLLTLFPFLSAITAIFVFLILQKGWQGSNEYLKFGFILFTTLTTLAGIYPKVYQQSESINNNLNAFLNYGEIQKDIFNYSLTAPIIYQDSILFLNFIDTINYQEKRLNNIFFDLRKESIDKEFLKSINSK